MAATRPALPTGTVTFLRTDVEGSMRHARALGTGWDKLNDRQLALIRDAIADRRGVVVRTEGDAVFAAFGDAGSALAAAVAIQRAVLGESWPPEAPVRVRVGLHAGEAHLAGDDYGGFEVNRAARIAAVGHGGQIVVSDSVRALVADSLPPDVQLRDLGRHPLRDVPSPEQLHQVDADGLPTDFPPPRTAARALGNLPGRLTSFLGRDRELEELEALLDESRLVTIVGPGGIGKTSLAIALGQRAGTSCRDGVWFVALDPVPEAALVGAAIAHAIGLYDGPGRAPIEGVGRWFADRSALLILDNFEHVLDAAVELPGLLRAAPGLRIVATSRAPLRIAGEQEYPLGPLALADAGAAVRLFEDRARAVVPGWSAGDEQAVVEEICRLLDGLPLGVELAAARVGLLPLTVLRDRLTARLPLPGRGPRDLPTRQRTLDGAIAWSYDLLAPPRQRLLRELSVFDGGFDLEQARAVATDLPRGEDVLDGVMDLADQSLAQPAGSAKGAPSGGVRFRLLETIRSFGLRALEQAGEERGARRRHAEAFVALAEQAAPSMPGRDQARWLDRLAMDHANVTAALRWTVEQGEVILAQRLAASTWRYFQIGGYLREGRGLIDAVLEMPGGQEPTVERLWAVAAAGGVAYWQGETDEANDRYRLQLAIAVEIGDRAGEADAAWNLAATDWIRNDMGGSAALIDRARSLYEALGDERGAARTEWGRGNLVVESGRVDEAIEMGLAARRRYAELGDVVYFGLAAGDLSFAYWIKGDVPEALRWGIESLRLSHSLRDRATTALTLGAVGAVGFAQLGHPFEAVVLVEAFDRLCEVHGIRPPAGFERMMRRPGARESLHAALSPEDDAAAVAQGRRMELDEAVAYAIATAEDIVGPEGLAIDEPGVG